MKSAYVYILASKSRVLYVGVTTNLERRIFEHRSGIHDGFTTKYRVNHLVHFETTSHIRAAIAREKEIKGWRREKKSKLIESTNAGWIDLAAGWL